MLETVFDQWVQEANLALLAPDDYPLIDSDAIDMEQEIRTLAHQVVREYPGYSSDSIAQNIERATVFFENRMISSNGALPVRFVILNFLYRLAHFDHFESETSAPELYGVVWPNFVTFVRLQLQEVSEHKDPKAVRWEIINACAIHAWDHAARLFDHLKVLQAITELECRALKGQMYLCSVAAPKTEQEFEEELELGVASRDELFWWVPNLDDAVFSTDGINRRALGLMAWGMGLADRPNYSPEERVRLSDAAHDWEIFSQNNTDVLSSYRVALGKAYLLAEEYIKAARQFEHLLNGVSGVPKELETPMRSGLYQNAAQCYELARAVDSAVHLLERCAGEFPQTKGLWLKLAGLYLSNPLNVDLERVRNCLRKEEEIDVSFGKDPRASFAMILAELAADSQHATLQRIAEPSPADLQLMTSVISLHWPSFQHLDEESQKKWVGAAHWLWGVSPPSWDRAALRQRVAGTFAEIVEAHLARLFDRFRREKGRLVLQKVSPDSRKERLPKYLQGAYLTLGEMVAEIDGACRQAEPRYPELKAWLQRNARRLLLNWDSKRAWRLNDFRRFASHPGSGLSEQDVFELYQLSAWFVDQLCGE
jgi:hypothetical protein